MIRVKGTNSVMRDYKKSLKLKMNSKLNTLVGKLSLATPKDTGEAAAGWRHDGQKIVNDVDHIDRLNEGSSKQAPAHFVEATILADSGVHPNGTIVRTTTR